MAGRIQEDDLASFHLDPVGADVLRDASRLPRRDVGLADGVEQRSLAVIDVPHDGHNRGPLFQVLRAVRLFDFVNHFLFVTDDGGLSAESARHLGGRLRVEGLVNRGEDAFVEQLLDNVPGARLKLLGKFLDADALADRDAPGDRHFNRRRGPGRRSNSTMGEECRRTRWTRRRHSSGGRGPCKGLRPRGAGISSASGSPRR